MFTPSLHTVYVNCVHSHCLNNDLRHSPLMETDYMFWIFRTLFNWKNSHVFKSLRPEHAGNEIENCSLKALDFPIARRSTRALPLTCSRCGPRVNKSRPIFFLSPGRLCTTLRYMNEFRRGYTSPHTCCTSVSGDKIAHTTGLTTRYHLFSQPVTD